jgi:hypothetical protein
VELIWSETLSGSARPEGQTMTDQDVAVATPSNNNDAERPERSVAEQLVEQARADGVDPSGLAGC